MSDPRIPWSRRTPRPARPEQVFDPMLQHERTALAWERTAIATMVAGVLLARYASELHLAASAFGVLAAVTGGLLLVWTARHYEDLHGPLREGESPVHPGAARVVGMSAMAFTGIATIIAVLIAVR